MHKRPRQNPRHVQFVCLMSLLFVTGCGVVGGPVASRDQGSPLQGKLQGGQQPISEAHVYLLAANTLGYGTASVSLLDATITGHSDSVGAYVLTDKNGFFSITSDYACTPDSQVYVYASGGNPGSGTNVAAGLLAVLGNCPAAQNFGSATFIAVNEVSTVAAAYAMSGYAVDATHVASSGTVLARTGIANAFASAANLVALSTGIALSTTPAGNGTVSQTLLNTLGNILSACVNSSGAVIGPQLPTACYQLFSNATADSTATGKMPTDTASAIINIAHHPGSNVAPLFSLATANAPFAPTLSQLPNDLGVSIIYRSQRNVANVVALNPTDIGLNSLGNVWLANYASSSVVELSTLGAILSPPAGFVGGGVYRPSGIAIDTLGNVWVSNSGQGLGASSFGTVSKFTNTGIPLSPASGFEGGGLIGAGLRIAIDGQANAWIVNGGAPNRITKLASDGTPLSPSTAFTGGGLNSPHCIAIDPGGNAWMGNNSRLSEFSSSGSSVSSSSGYQGGGLNGGYGIAIDNASNVWIANANNNSVSEFSSNGAAISPSTGFTGGGLSVPSSVAIDGAGSVWLASTGSVTAGALVNGGLNEFSSNGVALSPAKGYTASTPQAVAIDGSGNVWLAGTNDFAAVTEFVGLAVPVVTPIAAGALNNTLGTRP